MLSNIHVMALCTSTDFPFTHTGKCIRRFAGIYAHAICLNYYRIRSFISIRHAHGNLCKHLGIDSSTDLDDRYSNLFLNACINRHAHTEYLNMIEVYSPLGIWHVFLYSINTNIYHFRSMKYRQYA